MHRRGALRRRLFDRGEDVDVVFEGADIGHEHVEPPVARFDHERGAGDRVLRGPRRRARIGQRLRLRHRIGLRHDRIIRRLDVRQRRERQARAGRKVARQQEEMVAPHVPLFARPAHIGAAQRHDVRGRCPEPASEGAHHAGTRRRIEQFWIARIDVQRKS